MPLANFIPTRTAIRTAEAILAILICLMPKLAAEAAARTHIVMLGTGMPNAVPERSGPAVAIIVDGKPYLVDCGTGIVRRAAAASLKGIEGLRIRDLNLDFITHLHSDHTLGYADLILTPASARGRPLEVYGPKGLASMTHHILQAYREDIQIRTRGLEQEDPVGYQVRVHEIHPGVVYRDEKVTVKAFAVKHGSWKQAFGYRFETPDRTIVLSGDTTASDSIVTACNHCDVLIHEAYDQAGLEKRTPRWQKYHSQFHTSSRDLARLASQANPGILILYHQLFMGMPEQHLLDEIRNGYSGKVVSAHDLDVF